MRFHEFGDPGAPVVMLVHGGGNAWWNYLRQARVLAKRFRVVLPTLDGHGEEFGEEYLSTEAEAEKILEYIDKHCRGGLFLLGGVSLGGQIALEVLSRRADVARRAIIDGALCLPRPAMARACGFGATALRPLLFSRAACRLQLWALRAFFPGDMRFPAEMEGLYLRDMPRVSGRTLRTMYRTYMGEYRLKGSIARSNARIECWYGEREMRCVKESARAVASLAPHCKVREAVGCDHGTLADYRPDEWLRFAEGILSEDDPDRQPPEESCLPTRRDVLG